MLTFKKLIKDLTDFGYMLMTRFEIEVKKLWKKKQKIHHFLEIVQYVCMYVIPLFFIKI